MAKGILGESSDANAAPESNAAPGNTVYFVAHGQIVSGAPTDFTTMKLYRWRWNGGSPSVDYLGPYVSTRVDGTAVNGDQASSNNRRFDLVGDPNGDEAFSQSIRATPDGRYLMITSQVRYYDPAADRDSDVDAYRWDEQDGWICVSCQLPGTPSAGPVYTKTMYAGRTGGLVPLTSYAQRDISISADGKRIIFASPDALVPQDVNGEVGCPVISPGTALYRCEDVYEWNDGTLGLLTTGTGSEPFILMGTTASGTVFYETRQQLVGWDTDDGMDIYTTRIGGGFPEPPTQPPTCEGESCRGAGTNAPGATGAGTAVFQGQGNPSPKHKTGRKHHKKRHHKRQQRAAKHNRRAGR